MTKKIREKAWDECLRLWKAISEIPDQIVDDMSTFNFKHEVLVDLGIGYRRNGCPFCHYFYATKECPLGDCNTEISIDFPKTFAPLPCVNNFSYSLWSDKIDNEGIHRQSLARKFYNELLELKKRR